MARNNKKIRCSNCVYCQITKSQSRYGKTYKDIRCYRYPPVTDGFSGNWDIPDLNASRSVSHKFTYYEEYWCGEHKFK